MFIKFTIESYCTIIAEGVCVITHVYTNAPLYNSCQCPTHVLTYTLTGKDLSDFEAKQMTLQEFLAIVGNKEVSYTAIRRSYDYHYSVKCLLWLLREIIRPENTIVYTHAHTELSQPAPVYQSHIPLDSNSTAVPSLPVSPSPPPPPLLQVIAVNQDSLISQGRNVTTSANVAAHGQVWAKHLADGSVAVLLFNSVPSTTISNNNNDGPGGGGGGDAARGGNVNVTVTATWEQLGFKAGTVVHARSLWDQTDVPGTLQGSISASLPYHDSAVFKLTPASATSGTVKAAKAAEAAKIASLSSSVVDVSSNTAVLVPLTQCESGPTHPRKQFVGGTPPYRTFAIQQFSDCCNGCRTDEGCHAYSAEYTNNKCRCVFKGCSVFFNYSVFSVFLLVCS